MAIAAGACGCGTTYSLEPPPVAGGAPARISVRVLRAAVSKGLDRADGALGAESQVAVEMEIRNLDARRPATIDRLSLLVRDALGGPAVYAGPVAHDETGLTPTPERGSDPPLLVGPRTIAPGETAIVYAVFAGFPPDGPATPLRATIFVPVEGERPLEVAIVDPVPGGPRWRAGPRGAGFVTGNYGAVGSHDVIQFVEPLGLSWRRSSGRLIWGFGYRVSFLRRQLEAAGTRLDQGISLLGEVQWQPWHGIGVYLEGGAYAGWEDVGAGVRGVLMPRTSAGLVFGGGGRMLDRGLLPIDRPASAQRRGAIRVGYAHWFNTGDGWRAGGVQLSIETMISP